MVHLLHYRHLDGGAAGLGAGNGRGRGGAGGGGAAAAGTGGQAAIMVRDRAAAVNFFIMSCFFIVFSSKKQNLFGWAMEGPVPAALTWERSQ